MNSVCTYYCTQVVPQQIAPDYRDIPRPLCCHCIYIAVLLLSSASCLLTVLLCTVLTDSLVWIMMC